VRLGNALAAGFLASAGLLLYGALVEVDRLTLERRRLRLRRWPARLDGFRIGFLADFHLRDAQTVDLAQRAVAAVLDEAPDMVVLGGDFVSRWRVESVDMLAEVLEPLLLMQGSVVAVPGNRDYNDGDAELLRPILNEFNIRLLRNENWNHLGINWMGVDSANVGESDPLAAFESIAHDDPIVSIWHEPDLVDWLPESVALSLSGHSHGGQFTTPWGWAPVKSRNGERYLRGFYPDAHVPLYVSRGLGTTGPPSRLFCRPEATILELYSVEG
jgi:predicted MPP superfamily phosphohydrolase